MYEKLSSGVCEQQRSRLACDYFLESIISKLATSKISFFKLVSVAEQTGLGITWMETPKTGYLRSNPNLSESMMGNNS